MINKKLDDILQNISILKDIFNNNEYFKKIEEATERQNKWNDELVEKVNDLQSKIDKANELIETYRNERNTYKRLSEEYINKYNDLLERTKEGE